MDAVLEPVMRSPLFPKLLKDLNDLAAEEERKRRCFVETLAPDRKAEFIDGEAVLHSPARARHLDVTANLLFLLKRHVFKTGKGRVFAEKCLVSLTRNDYEPDVVYYGPEKAVRIEPGQMRFPAPDLVVEVLSESTVARDRGVKFEDYAAHGVREYWIVDPEAGTIEQFLLPDGGAAYQLHEKLGHGTLRARVMEGLEVPVAAVFDEEACRGFASGPGV